MAQSRSVVSKRDLRFVSSQSSLEIFFQGLMQLLRGHVAAAAAAVAAAVVVVGIICKILEDLRDHPSPPSICSPRGIDEKGNQTREIDRFDNQVVGDTRGRRGRQTGETHATNRKGEVSL